MAKEVDVNLERLTTIRVLHDVPRFAIDHCFNECLEVWVFWKECVVMSELARNGQSGELGLGREAEVDWKVRYLGAYLSFVNAGCE